MIIRNDISKTYIIISDTTKGISEYRINEEMFHNVLSHMTDIRRELMPILNTNKLIFPAEDSLSPDEWKEKITQEYVNAG